MIVHILAKILGTANERTLRKIQPLVHRINELEKNIKELSDGDLAQKTVSLKAQLAAGKSLDDILPEAYAVVREAAFRTIGQRHYDVQLIGGIALHQGKIAEMKTGEGKTLTATLPLYLNALAGKGAHLVTVNDYLARRDAQWMGKVYEFLGLSVACLQNQMTDSERRSAYQADILYATNNELGFDYLRDNMKYRLEDYVQRDLHYAIVDEVDSILIDEARTPLIISGAVEESGKLYQDADRAVARLTAGVDYEVNEKDRIVLLTESGNDKIEQSFNVENLYAVEQLSLLHHVNQALRAHALFRRDVDYVVKDDQVFIVDEFTGRILPGRRYSDGLHQALEAKEGVRIEEESQTLAAITLQNFFRMYSKLAGMTGTAATEAEEFHAIYKLDVLSVPTNKPMIRDDKPDLIFLTNNAKYKAIVEDVKLRYQKGQPVLIGTVAVETSELLSKILRVNGVAHEVLNAKQHEREAEIVEHAGEVGRVTIATNMAGRGTDIKLTQDSVAAGGLYILGTERHESRRIDNQLRGRSGRQGDPGESRFYISLEDDLIRIFSGDSLKRNMERFGMKEDEVIESRLVSRNIERSQEKVEKHYYEIRKHLLEYDDVLNQQRIVVYKYRRNALEGEESVFHLIGDFISRIVQIAMAHHAPTRTINAATVETILHDLAALTGVDIYELRSIISNDKSSEQVSKDVLQYLLKKYNKHRTKQGQEYFKQEKWLLLSTIDQAWKQHMLNLDHLKEGINLRSWGQKNPLIEYKREAFDMFTEMMSAICQQVVFYIYRLDVSKNHLFDEKAMEQERSRELEDLTMTSSVSEQEESVQKLSGDKSPGRNQECHCRSGKKFKKCHGK